MVPPATIGSSSWSSGQGVESISQLLQVFGAELPDPDQDARAVVVNGVGRQTQLTGDLAAGSSLEQVPLEAGPARRPCPGADSFEGEGQHPTPVRSPPPGIRLA